MPSDLTLGLPITPGLTPQRLMESVTSAFASNDRLLITFLNPWIFSKSGLLDKGSDYLFAHFDIVACDGIGLVWAIRFLTDDRTLKRISFDETSCALPFFECCIRHDKEVVLVGGEPGVAEKAAEALRTKLNHLNVVASFDGFDGVAKALQFLELFPSTVVVCGMGLPHQERFLVRATSLGWAGVGVTCGGYFDQITHVGSYYPSLVDRLNLRWAYRLYREPKRLWRRYLIEYVPFARRFGRAVLLRLRNRVLDGI